MKYADEKIIDGGNRVYKALGVEGSGVNHFWTFAPYLHHQLVANGFSRKNSIKLLLSWVKDSLQGEETPLHQTLNGLNLESLFNKTLELEREDELKARLRVESGLGKWPTHELAAQLAIEFAPVLLKAYGDKKKQ